MKRILSVWMLMAALLLGGALPAGTALGDMATTQWSAAAASKSKKKKNKKKSKKKKNKKQKKNKANKKSRKKDKKSRAGRRQQQSATMSTLASVPTVDAASGRVGSAAPNSLLQVTVPGRVANTVVNYKAMTVNFNPQLRIPNCVAYELTATMVSMTDAPGHEVRKNYNYAQDPAVKGCPGSWEYRGSGYTRGHMAPAMDMRWDKTTMAQCFMMTNMCPQEEKLNNDHWRRLEERIHRWAKRDKRLIIFTGPIMGNSHLKIGKDRADIAVPEAFFKVLYAPGQGRAIAFIYANKPCPGSYRNYAVTVQEVERRTGLTFPSAIPKRQCNPGDWE